MAECYSADYDGREPTGKGAAMKVLIVYTNTLKMLAAAPLGAALVADRLRRDGHTVRLLDLMFARSATATAARVAREFAPDLVGFSLRNVDNQSPTDPHDPLPITRAIVAAVQKAAPRAVTLLGGTAFTTFPGRYLGELGADYGLAGDDLAPVSRFVSSLAAGVPDLSTAGLVYWGEDGRVRQNPYAIAGYAQTAFTCWDLIDYRPYRRAFASFADAAVVTRTGCPFGCIFCDTYRTFGRRWVLRDPRQIAEEAVALRRRHGVRLLYLADAGFNRPLDHAKAVLEALIAARPGVTLDSVFEPGEVDREFVDLYRRAGGQSVMLFAGSLADPVLAACHKPFHVADVLTGAGLLARGGVAITLALQAGLPGETPATLEETFARSERISSVYTWLDRGLRILPETPLRDLAVAEGLLDPAEDCFRSTFYHSPATSPTWLNERMQAYRRAHRDWSWQATAAIASYLRGKATAWL